MIILVCLDDKDGMMFGSRRQSKDGVLRDRILNDCMGKNLYMNEYSYKMFSENTGNFAVSREDFLEVAGADDYCFVEDCDVRPYGEKIERIVVYRWNRLYPSTMKFVFPDGEWRRVSVEEIAGSSHDITAEVYER